MEMGKKLLAAGQLADALSHFHAAVGECQRHANDTKKNALDFPKRFLLK